MEPDVATDEERIVGGSDGNPGNYPYLASLQSGGPQPAWRRSTLPPSTFLQLGTASNTICTRLSECGTLLARALRSPRRSESRSFSATQTFAATLKTVDVKIFTDECAQASGNTATNTTLCAGIGDGKDVCGGDSVGPHIANDAVVGSGPKKCGTSAGYYTWVSSLLGYIHDILNSDSAGNVTEFLVIPYNYSYDPCLLPAVGSVRMARENR